MVLQSIQVANRRREDVCTRANNGASAWKLQCLQEVEELCSSDFDPKYGNRLLLTVSSDESTREAEKARVSSISVGVKMRNQCVRTWEEKEKSSVRILTNSKCLTDGVYFRDSDQTDQKTQSALCQRGKVRFPRASGDIGYDCYSLRGLLYKSVSKEMKMRERNVTPILMLQAGTTISGQHLVDQWREDEETAGSRLEAWDDLTGLPLDPKGVPAARKQELDYISQKKVWEVAPREEARRNGWKIIKSRWIGINKGDDVASLYRSRLVGKEFADKNVDGLFAGTPPLEALRFLVHEAATVEGEEEEQGKVIMMNDVARAFF